MFGTLQSEGRSFSETWYLLPDSDDDGDVCEGDEKILSVEELVERFKTLDIISDTRTGGRGYSPEAVALLCTVLTCVSWSRTCSSTSLTTLIDPDAFVQAAGLFSSNLKSITILNKNENYRDTVTDQVSHYVNNAADNDRRYAAGSIVSKNNSTDYCSCTWITLCKHINPRAPPLRRCCRRVQISGMEFVENGNVDNLKKYSTEQLCVIFENNSKQRLQNRLYSNSFLHQADRRQLI